MKQIVVTFEHTGVYARIEEPLPATTFVASSMSVAVDKVTEMLGLAEKPELEYTRELVHTEGEGGEDYVHTVPLTDNPNRIAKVNQKGMHCRIFFKHVDFVG